MTTENGYYFKLPEIVRIPLRKMLKARQVLKNLTEIHLMACTFGDHIEIYKWPILPVDQQTQSAA